MGIYGASRRKMAPNVLSERETDPSAGLVSLQQRITTACCFSPLQPSPLNNEPGWFPAWPGSSGASSAGLWHQGLCMGTLSGWHLSRSQGSEWWRLGHFFPLSISREAQLLLQAGGKRQGHAEAGAMPTCSAGVCQRAGAAGMRRLPVWRSPRARVLPSFLFLLQLGHQVREWKNSVFLHLSLSFFLFPFKELVKTQK